MGFPDVLARIGRSLASPYSLEDAVREKLRFASEMYKDEQEALVRYLLSRKTEKVLGNIERRNRRK